MTEADLAGQPSMELGEALAVTKWLLSCISVAVRRLDFGLDFGLGDIAVPPEQQAKPGRASCNNR